MRNIFFIITFISISSFFSKASDIYFYHLGLRDGLSQMSVMSIYQDELGAMWFGTTEGLNRYNGKHIQIFRPNNNGVGLTQNMINTIEGNKQGAIYLKVGLDLVKYDLYTQSYETLLQGDVRAIQYKDSLLWLVVGKEIKQYDEKTGDFKLVTALNNDISDINTIFVSSRGVIWVGTMDGLISISANNINKQKSLLSGSVINCIYEDKDQNIWVGTKEAGLYLIDVDGDITNYVYKPDSNSISNNQVRTITEDAEGNIWVGTFLGLNMYDRQTHLWQNYFSKDNIEHSLSHSSVFSLYKDKHGTIWVGTYFGGTNYFNPDSESIVYYGSSSSNQNYLSFPFVGRILEDRYNKLWICTEGGGLNMLDLDTRQLSRYRFHTDKKEYAELNNLKSIWYRDDKDLLYISIYRGGLAIFNIKTQKVRYIWADVSKANALPSNTTNRMQYYKGMLVLLTQEGLMKMDLDTELFYPLSEDPSIQEVLADIELQTFFIDGKDRLWIQKNGGVLLCIDLVQDKIRAYRSDFSSEVNKIGHFKINDIFETSLGQLFFATAGSGIFVYNEETDNFTNYTVENNRLLSNYCYSISELPSGKLALLFNNGFSTFDPNNTQEIQFRSSPHFPLIGFNIGSSSYTTENGETFIGGINGLVSFYEPYLNRENQKSDIYIDNLYVNNKLVTPADQSNILNKCLSLTNKIILQPNQNNISIEFASSNYLQMTECSYVYQLDGFDKEWIEVDESMTITYTNLNPGHYRLIVKNMSGLGKDASNFQFKELIIVINPPFYKTEIAYILYFLLTIILVVIIIRFYSWRARMRTTLEFERKEKERIEDLNNMKFRFFTNISHEFRTPLTLIIGQVDILLNNIELKEEVVRRVSEVRKNALQLQSLITELLDFRKQEQGFNRLEVAELELVGYMQEIYNSFLDYAEKQSLQFIIESDQPSIHVFIDPVQFQKVVYNLLSNAFKYTSEGGEVKIHIGSDSDNVYLEIYDSGIGIPTESLRKIFDRFYQLEYRSSGLTLGTGIGLALTKEIVLAHKGTISVASKVDIGSCFTIVLKKGTSHFSEEELEVRSANRLEFALKNDMLEALSKDCPKNEDIVKVDVVDRQSVLLVEDNDELIGLLSEIFSEYYNVFKARDGEEGWTQILELQPDIVISDIMMPKLTGKELCYRIKNNINTSHIPVVLLTAQTSDSEILDGLMLGADVYVTKPFNIQILLQSCVNLLNNRRNRYKKELQLGIENKTKYSAIDQDKILIENAVDIINKNLSNSSFDMNILAYELGLGRTKLYTRIKDITGFTPNEFTLNVKLQEAANLLENKPEMNVSEIAFYLGFSSAKYFTKCFKTFYGMPPVDWRKQNSKA